MKRILVIGCCGSGKTTLALKFSQKLGLPLVHLDALYWRDNWQVAPKEEFDRLLNEALHKPEWIIDGNFNSTLPLRMQYCDTVIFLDLARPVCLWGVLKRVIKNYGKTRPDIGQNCPEHFDTEFLKYVWNFNHNHRSRYYQLLSELKDVRVITLKSRKEIHNFLSSL